MTLQIHQFACLADNYAFLCRDHASGAVACIDTPDGEAILREAAALGWPIDLILNTHWHPDHTDGNAAIKAATGARIVAPAEVARTSEIDRIVEDGDRVELGETSLSVIAAGGHTLGHIAYYAPDAGVLFAGDTLFPMGCGRLFEGEPEQMWVSLTRLAALPPDTLVYAAHEYGIANARFAASVDADPATLARAASFEARRANGQATVPAILADELATNPFLRAGHLAPGGPVAAFAAIRAARDVFKA